MVMKRTIISTELARMEEKKKKRLYLMCLFVLLVHFCLSFCIINLH